MSGRYREPAGWEPADRNPYAQGRRRRGGAGLVFAMVAAIFAIAILIIAVSFLLIRQEQEAFAPFSETSGNGTGQGQSSSSGHGQSSSGQGQPGYADVGAVFDSLTDSGASVCLDRDGSVRDLSGALAEEEGSAYAIDVVLHAPTKAEKESAFTMQDLREIVAFRNDSADEWTTVCLRDYAQMHLDLLRASYGLPQGEDPFDEIADTRYGEIVDGRTGEAVQMRRDPGDASVVWIDLAEPLRPGERMQLYLTYAYPLFSDVDSGVRNVFGYSDNSSWFASNGSKPVLTVGNFYPILAMYGEDGWNTAPGFDDGECFCSPVATYEAAVAAPDSWLVVTTGEERRVSEAADGGTDSSPDGSTGGSAADGIDPAAISDGYTCWRAQARKVRDFALVAGEGLVQKSETLDDGVTVTATYYESHSDRNAEILLKSGVYAVEAFTEAFGPYPYDTLDVVCCPLFGGGMEYPQIVFISDELASFAEMFENDADALSTSCATVTAHEVGHNWFYGTIGNDEYREAWLDESFASYCEHVYRMYLSENGLGDTYSWDDAEEEVWNQAYGHDRYIDVPYNEMRSYQTTVYPYGCFFLLRLRRAMGDEAFTRMMHTYYAENMYRVATTEDFLNALRPEILQNSAAQRLCGQFLSQY